jgi:hypothetical protein
MVVIKERKLLRCCHNCKSFLVEYDNETSCEHQSNKSEKVEPTGVCQFFIRS